MNLIFWRNIFCVAVIVTFVLDLVFGNGVANWWDWLFGFVFWNAANNLLSSFEKHHGTKVYRANENFVSDVLNLLVIIFFVLNLIFGNGIEYWHEWFSGVAVAFSVHVLLTLNRRSHR